MTANAYRELEKLATDQNISALRKLVADDSSWVIRRKYRYEFVNPRLYRWQLSVDLSTPVDPISVDGVPHVPLCFLPKEPGRSFAYDVVSPSGRSLPLPTRQQNAFASALVLDALAAKVLGQETYNANAKAIRSHVRFAAFASKDSAIGALGRAWFDIDDRGALVPRQDSSWRAELCADPTFAWLLQTVSTFSLVLVPLDPNVGSGGRQIIKLSATAPLPKPNLPSASTALRAAQLWLGWRNYVATFDIPWTSAASTHVEVVAPDGLDFVHLEGTTEGQLLGAELIDRQHAHLYSQHAAKPANTSVGIMLRVSAAASGIPALLLALAVTCVLWYLALDWRWARDHLGSQSVAVLLLTPALIMSYLSGQTHAVTRALLEGRRVALLAVTACAIVAAARLSLVWREGGNMVNPIGSSDATHLFLPLSAIAGLAACVMLAAQLPRIFARK